MKTRLTPAVPSEIAARVYEGLLRDTLASAAACGADERWLWWAERDGEFATPGTFEHRVQRGGELGERLLDAFSEMLDGPAVRAVVVGSDCPALAPDLLARAFTALESADLAIAPTRDGGYWLIGLRRPEPELFRDIPWSTDRAFAATLARAAGLGLRVETLPMLDDLDTPADLARLIASVATDPASACGPHAAEALRRAGLAP